MTQITTTIQQYDQVIDQCKDVFLKKTHDYGTSWRVLRTISIIDQLFIKVQRIRTIQDKGVQKIGDDIGSEFIGIINYAIIGLIQLEKKTAVIEELSVEEVQSEYDRVVAATKSLMLKKNHDYGEAWRSMSQEGLTDLILVKLLRVRQILQNDGKTLISEGIDANYMDILNYAVFALIQQSEK